MLRWIQAFNSLLYHVYSLGGGQTVNDIEAGGLTGHLWRSGHPGTGAGGLFGPWWWSDRQGQFCSPENQFLEEKFLQEIQPIQISRPLRNLYGPRRRTVVLTQNFRLVSHKKGWIEQSGN
jgi:hypothetical protein